MSSWWNSMDTVIFVADIKHAFVGAYLSARKIWRRRVFKWIKQYDLIRFVVVSLLLIAPLFNTGKKYVLLARVGTRLPEMLREQETHCEWVCRCLPACGQRLSKHRIDFCLLRLLRNIIYVPLQAHEWGAKIMPLCWFFWNARGRRYQIISMLFGTCLWLCTNLHYSW